MTMKMKIRSNQHNHHTMTKVSDLPISILMYILSTLPVKDLYSCRRVCKSWLTLLSDPYFAKLHHSVAPTGVLLLNSPLRHIRFIEFFQESSSLSLSSEHNSNVLKFRTSSNFYSNPRSMKNLEHTNSFNGLLCFYEYEDGFYICNPIINQYVRIRDPRIFTHSAAVTVNVTAGRIRTVTMMGIRIHGELLELELPHPLLAIVTDRQTGPFLNGALHYLLPTTTTSRLFESICCFDVVDESFRFVPSPPKFGDGDYRREPITRMSFSVLRNCLCIALYPSSQPPTRFEVWMMTDYGVKDSWTKVITMTEGIDIHTPYHPLILFNNGEIIMWVLGPKCTTVLVSFDPKTRNFKLVPTYKRSREFFSEYGPIPFVPSFVSLKDVVGEQHFKNLERGRRVRIREKSLKREVFEEEATLEELNTA
ncbi:hypothetical protein F0562_022186 [Nyssa sinensis]|uniref:F-box domain-containing protein n=1 Tax=Nyssa sinensis TaxID=561372 RepID=A0A5J5BN49_9ASTE|nr:hypothetical protein F0562_022186 [Nyssa sinensis]